MGIHLGIGNLLGRERPAAPIRPLVPFVCSDTEFLRQYGGQPVLPPAKNSRSQHRVKQVDKRVGEIPLQAKDVILGRMEHLLHRRVGRQLSQAVEIWETQRINDIILVQSRDLDQADLLAVCVQAVRLGINRQRTRPL